MLSGSQRTSSNDEIGSFSGILTKCVRNSVCCSHVHVTARMGFLAVLNLTALDEGEEAFLFLTSTVFLMRGSRAERPTHWPSFPGQ